MIWFWVVVLVLVVGAVAVLAAGRDDSMSEAYEDRPDHTIPAGGALTSSDLQNIRFSSALRGYRMDEVDTLIDRLAADLAAREADEREGAVGSSDRSTPVDDPAPTHAETARLEATPTETVPAETVIPARTPDDTDGQDHTDDPDEHERTGKPARHRGDRSSGATSDPTQS